MFKPGDKVRRTAYNSHGGCNPGDTATVEAQNDKINLILREYPNCVFTPGSFELVEETKPISKGARYNSGKLRWRNVPMFLLEPIIEVGSKAEKHEGNPDGKYPTFNFLNGMGMNDSLDSLKRHLMKFESPYHSDNDEESQCSHLAHIAWNAIVALHNLKTRPDLDDRWKSTESEE